MAQVFIPISGSNIGSHLAQIFVDIHSITPEDLCRERAEMLSTTKDALLKWCGVLDQMAKDGGVCVIGHDGAIAACEKEDLTVL